jgi:polar amino acid transport system permease protein
MALDPSILLTYGPQFLAGAWLTLRISLGAFVLGYALGVALALVALMPGWLPRMLVTSYVTVLRAIPFVITLFVVYYGLPFAGIRLPAPLVGTVALALFASAYYAEVVRAAILAVPRGQFDSARAIGMTGAQAMRHIIAPQILRALMPPSTNTTLSMMKESSVLSAITVPELTYQGLAVQGQTYAVIEVFFAVTLLYWLMACGIAALAQWAERRLGRAQAGAVLRSEVAARYLSLDWRVRA